MIFSVGIRGMDLAKQALGKFSKAGPEGIKKAVSITALNIQRKAKHDAPVDSGDLRSKIILVFLKDGFVGRVIADAPHAAFMELGTSHSKMPPPSALQDWAVRHGLPNGFVVARSIFLHGGLKPRPFLKPAYDLEAPQLPKRIIEEINKKLYR